LFLLVGTPLILSLIVFQKLSFASLEEAFQAVLLFNDSHLRPFLFSPVLRCLRVAQVDPMFKLPFEWADYLRRKLTR